ncbi:MAG: cytochrome C biogenesis protein [Halieaceae bacterium]
MSLFLLACAGLLVFSALFYALPRRWQGPVIDDPEQANLEWYRLRQRELAELGDEELEQDAKLRLLEDSQASAPVQAVEQGAGSFPVWLLLPLVAVMASALYYFLGAATDVEISKQLQSISEASSADDMSALVEAIEKRSAQRPDNLHYVALLGRFYMGQEDYIRAREVYRQLAIEAPEDAQAMAYAAQADFLASGRKLSDEARMQAEQALAVDPHQRTALGLLGMASFEQGLYRAAIEYWQRLLAMETPGSESAQMIGSVIAMANEKLGEGVANTDDAPQAGPMAPEAASGGVATPGEATPGEATRGVTVSVSFPEGARFSPGDTVFVLARNAESQSRMPIAVQRLQAAQLPLTLRLDDASSMAGQKLSETESVLVVVQVSPGGTPGEAGATFLGEAGPLAPSASTEPVAVVLAPHNI